MTSSVCSRWTSGQGGDFPELAMKLSGLWQGTPTINKKSSVLVFERKGIKEEIGFSRRRQCLVMYCISHDESHWMMSNKRLSVD